MNKKILVTGGTGLIGKYLNFFLPSAIYVGSKDFNLINENEVKNMFNEIRPNIVIHLAALVGGVHHNIEEPVKYFEENLLMNTLVLKESYKHNVDRFTGILSSCIYPNKISEYPIKEDKLLDGAPHEDLFSYSYAKRCLAIQIDMYNKKYNTKYNYLIPCNLYGEFDKFDSIQGHFVGALIQKIIDAKKNKSKKIILFGDGTPYRQFMHAKDIAKLISIMVLEDKFFSMNIATNENYSVEHIAKIALKACDAKEMKIEYDETKPNGQMRKDIEISKMQKYFQAFQVTKLEDGIREIYQKRIKVK
tara:strand:- start:273 stop:1184 length:912 start_codon:yes stop_codon:yes gene_type:complete